MSHAAFGRRSYSLPLLLCALILTLVAGCGNRNGIVGKWHGDVGAAPASATIDIEYKADGTATSAIKSPRQTMNMQSTYTQSGDALTETVTGVSVNGMTVPIPATAKTTERRTIRIDGDTLTLSDASRPGHLTLTRIH